MKRFVALSFSDQAKVDQAIDALRKMPSDSHIKVYGSAIVAKDASGKPSVVEITKEGHGGAAVGALIGALAGLPVGPSAATLMAAGGAAIGDAADITIDGDFAEFANSIACKFAPGGAVIVAEVAEGCLAAFEAKMLRVGGSVLVTQ